MESVFRQLSTVLSKLETRTALDSDIWKIKSDLTSLISDMSTVKSDLASVKTTIKYEKVVVTSLARYMNTIKSGME